MRKTKTRSKSGIYKIGNTINNKCYIGSAVDPKARFYTHISQLRRRNHHSIALQRAWDKYGEQSFIFEILEECEAHDLIIKEQHYIDLLLPEYNICKIAGSCLGSKGTPESNLKKSINSRNKGKFGKNNPDSIEIFQYDLDGTFIKKWYGTKEIERETGFNASNIGKCSKCSDRTCYKFFWSRKYLGEKIEPLVYRNREKCEKPVAMCDLDGNVLRQFKSQKEAAMFLNKKSNAAINVALKDTKYSAYGYKWKYTQ